jgi:metal-responsive CopG/Arc/MetJ family transcriptional regulator
VAKVLVSLPDALLRELDARAEGLGETRSAYLRRLAEEDIERREQWGREEAGRLLDLIQADFGDDEPPANAAQLIREARDSR